MTLMFVDILTGELHEVAPTLRAVAAAYAAGLYPNKTRDLEAADSLRYGSHITPAEEAAAYAAFEADQEAS